MFLTSKYKTTFPLFPKVFYSSLVKVLLLFVTFKLRKRYLIEMKRTKIIILNSYTCICSFLSYIKFYNVLVYNFISKLQKSSRSFVLQSVEGLLSVLESCMSSTGWVPLELSIEVHLQITF